MPSTPSDRLRIELQARGENVNSWGDTRLNDAFKRVEEAVAGVLTLTITGDTVLTSANYTVDQARMGTLVLTGTPAANFRITIPGVQKTYNVINLTGRVANFGVADMGTASVRAGVLSLVVCDGSITRVIDPTLDQVRAPAATLNLNAQRITNLATATGDTDAVPRAQVTALTSGAVESANASAVSAANSRDRAIDAEEDAEEARDQAQAALADFLNRYVVESQFPTTGNFAGRIAFAVNAGQFGVYDQNTGAFQAITLPQQATEGNSGIARLATASQVLAGTDQQTIVTPATARFSDRTLVVSRSSNTQLTQPDMGSLLNLSGTFTQTLAPAASLGAGWSAEVRSNNGIITIDPNGSEQIDGQTTVTVEPGDSRLVVCTGSGFVSRLIRNPDIRLISEAIITTPVAAVTFTDLSISDGYIDIKAVTLAAADPVPIDVSVNNGATWINTGTALINTGTTPFSALLAFNGLSTGTFFSYNSPISAPNTVGSGAATAARYNFYSSSLPVNAVRVRSPNNFTAGAIRMFGRR